MAKKKPIGYKDAGVNIDEADRAVASIRTMARDTFSPAVLTDIGSFGGGYLLKGYASRCWFPRPTASAPNSSSRSSPDAIPPSAKIWSTTASTTSPCKAPSPLFFLDYFAVGKLDARVAAEVVVRHRSRLQGERLRADRRRDRGDAGPLRDGEYDLAGFIVGAVENEAHADRRARSAPATC